VKKDVKTVSAEAMTASEATLFVSKSWAPPACELGQKIRESRVRVFRALNDGARPLAFHIGVDTFSLKCLAFMARRSRGGSTSASRSNVSGWSPIYHSGPLARRLPFLTGRAT